MPHDVEFSFKDNRMIIKERMADHIEAALLECSAELVSQTARNTRVDTGKTKGSWASDVRRKGAGYEAVIGSPEENAIWEEFGTGEYALEGNGRKGGWAYIDPDTGDRIWTRGKKPSRAFWNAWNSLKKTIQSHLNEVLKGL